MSCFIFFKSKKKNLKKANFPSFVFFITNSTKIIIHAVLQNVSPKNWCLHCGIITHKNK